EDSLQTSALEQCRHRIDVGRAGKKADQTDSPAGTDRIQGFCERARAANLDHVLYAFPASQLQYVLVPIGRVFIIDHLGGAHLVQALELCVAACSRDYACAMHPRELQREYR